MRKAFFSLMVIVVLGFFAVKGEALPEGCLMGGNQKPLS